jgi:bacteriocin biosynthesis cyclodehydratase domain-containing protein
VTVACGRVASTHAWDVHDSSMQRIDPRLPLLWRTPSEIQLGFASPSAVLSNLTPAEEYVVSALHSGVSDVSLRALAAQRGMTDDQLSGLLALIGPALEPPAGEALPQVALEGGGLGAARIAHTLRDADFSLVDPTELIGRADSARNSGTSRADITKPIAIVVATMALAPERCGRWLRRGVRHLPVVWLDTHVQVGPLIEPGRTACWHCIELARCDEDSARRALVTQVAGRPAATETNRITQEVALRIARWLDGSDAPESGDALVCQVSSGRWRRMATTPHAACSCHTPRGNETALALVDDPNPTPTTTGEVAPPRASEQRTTTGAPRLPRRW